MHPITVGIEVILYEIFGNAHMIDLGEFAGFFPGGGFDAQKLDVAAIGAVFKEPVGELVQQKLAAIWQCR